VTRFGMAALAMLLAGAAGPPQADAQCASYSCWRLSGSGKEGYACMMGGLMGQSTCVATVSGCLRASCANVLLTGPGGRVLARWSPCGDRRASVVA
jgi:hypothetical protein